MLSRLLSLLLLVLVSSLSWSQEIDPKKGRPDEVAKTIWYDLSLLGIEGKAWQDTKNPFDRFPARAEKTVPASVWGLSRQSAGLAARFITESPYMQIKWLVTNEKTLALAHMPATGVSGIDLYVRKSPADSWHWLNVGKPTGAANLQKFNLPEGKNEYLVYFPLYNGTSMIEVGLPQKAVLAKGAPRNPSRQKPIVFYGTSITQGGCASRPGMVHTAIIGRRLDYPVVNLGFSGNGKMDEGVVALIAEIDAALFVIDCLPNMTPELITARTVPTVQTLRKAHPTTPILLVEDRTYANASVMKSVLETNLSKRAAFKAEYEKLLSQGVKGLTYLKGDDLIGDDGEGTVDSSHPTDLGFLRQAEAFMKAMGPILPKKE